MITLKHDNDPYNDNIRLNWRNDSRGNFIYRIFRRKISNSIGIDKEYNDFAPICVVNVNEEGSGTEEDVSVLNIHPNCGGEIQFNDYIGDTITIKESEILRKWLYEATEEAQRGYGLGRIKINSISVSEFNANPKDHLFSEDGINKYDVVCIGFFEEANVANVNEHFTAVSRDALSKYIDMGFGVLLGHDVLSGFFGTNKHLGPLRSKFGIELGQWDENKEAGFDYSYKFAFQGNKIVAKRSGHLMSYPWSIASEGDEIDIESTHTTSQVANGDIWLSFVPQRIIGDEYMSDAVREKGNFYLTTYKSSAMIQVGHRLDIKPIEKKILANAIFHVKQMTKSTSFVDVTGVDDERPSVPTILNHYVEPDTFRAVFDYRSDDIGVIVQYYVEAIDTSTLKREISNVIEAKHTSGIKCFEYKLEQIASDTPARSINTWVKTKDKLIVSDELKKGYYSFRVRAIDKSLNRSNENQIVFFMPGVVNREKSPAVTKYPNVQRVNHRYRGPHESRKANDVIAQATFNINKLKAIVSQLEKDKMVMLERPKVDYASIFESKDIVHEHARNIREKRLNIIRR